MKQYKEIEITAGMNIDKALDIMINEDDLCCFNFNGNMIYSDIDDVDSAYLKVTGKTKSKFKKIENHIAELEQKRIYNKNKTPTLVENWIKEGERILDGRYHDDWKKCVPIRLGDLYNGMELKASLELIEMLNTGESFESVKKVMLKQRHSGMSARLVGNMVESFCDRGLAFSNYVFPNG